MKTISAILAYLLVSWCSSRAQVAQSFAVEPTDASQLPLSNSVVKIVPRSDTLWLGSARGLSYTLDAGRSWRHFGESETFDSKGVSAIAIRGDLIWAATTYSTELQGQKYQTGHRLHFSTDRGATWKFIPQVVDSGKVDTLTYGRNKIPALAITVPQQNVTYDIALTSNGVWTANWAGMLRQSTDQGKTWRRVVLPPDNLNTIAPTDSLRFSLSPVQKFFASDSLYNKDTLRASYNHMAFALCASDDSTLWVGTANGINKSTDGGISWRKFNHQNQLKSISGNFVVAITEQRWKGKRIVWAATSNALDQDERKGVSYSTDGGETWSTTLLGEFAHNIAVRDSLVYVAADGGLYRSSDFGQSWIRSGSVFDPTNLQRLASPVVYGTAAKGDTVWFGGADGLAHTIDSPASAFGSSCRVFRTYESVRSTGATYSYPLPFSPASEVVRIHYSTSGTPAAVSIRVFDFAMQPVRFLIHNAPRGGNAEYDEIWDGRDDLGRRVANGIYFYRVEIEGNSPQWGKIFVLQ